MRGQDLNLRPQGYETRATFAVSTPKSPFPAYLRQYGPNSLSSARMTSSGSGTPTDRPKIQEREMSRYQFHDDSGAPIDSHFEVQSGELILHSRGGTIGSANARNTQYGPALRILLERIHRSELTLTGVWVDSTPTRRLPIDHRAIFFPDDSQIPPQELSKRFSSRMAAVGRSPTAQHGKGNSTKRLLFTFAEGVTDERIARVAGWAETDAISNEDARLPTATLNQVSADHIWRAVERLVAGEVSHSFSKSTDYDVIADDGTRLPPKAVFGLAASEALGFEVRPRHFRGGLDTPCFHAINDAGYRIVPKDEEVQRDELPPDPEERFWVEGYKKLMPHLRRERGSGLARAKKRAFKRKHGRLFCEQCKLDPEAVFGVGIGEACIEVHHILPLGTDQNVRKTKLTDLICVCANCHKVIHYELRKNLRRR